MFGYILLLLPPAICGMVVGFLLLDQRDEQTLRALQVTPLPLWGYVAYRLAAPMLLSVAMTIVALPLSGVVALGPAALLAAAPIAPAVALFLAAFAANKVQGFALQKVLGVFLVVPALAPFLPMPGRSLRPACRPSGRPCCSGRPWRAARRRGGYSRSGCSTRSHYWRCCCGASMRR